MTTKPAVPTRIELTPPEPAPGHCTCVTCEVRYRLARLSADPTGSARILALAEWVANGPEADRSGRDTVREILGL